MISHAEKLLIEAVQSYLQDNDNLGLPKKEGDETEHGLQFMHEEINELFALRSADLIHHESICNSFRKIHSYRYVTDPAFYQAMDKEMSAKGIPGTERTKALKIVEEVIKEVQDGDGWQEQDAGLHPDLDEIIDVSKPGEE